MSSTVIDAINPTRPIRENVKNNITLPQRRRMSSPVTRFHFKVKTEKPFTKLPNHKGK
jgi:hypothetical protein